MKTDIQQRTLRYETLETREFLAADLDFSIKVFDGHPPILIYECTRTSCPPADFGSTTPDAPLTLGVRIQNLDTKRSLRNIDWELAGSDVPDAFSSIHSCTRTAIGPGSNCQTIVAFHPPTGDAPGTVYGGDEQSAIFTWTASNAQPLSIVLVGTSRDNVDPVADAGGPYSASEGNAILFDASSSTDGDGDPLSYQWDFGDGTVVTTNNPTVAHTYEWGESFNVTLTADDGVGGVHAIGTTAAVAEVNDDPIADVAGPYQGELGAVITFDASASTDFDNLDGFPGNDQTLTYDWDFGDGITASTTNSMIDHAYSAVGDYVVTVAVDDGIATSSPALTTANISTAPVGSANDIYIWDIDLESKRRGNRTDYRIVLDVQRDSDANGIRNDYDASAVGVSVVATFRDSSGDIVGTYTGTTDSNGIFRGPWNPGLIAGEEYTAEVELSHPIYDWNHLIDLAFADDDDDGLPEYFLSAE